MRLRSVARIAALAAIVLFTSASALRISAPHGFVTRTGDRLVLNGHSFRFTGVNAFQLATDYAVNTGCGSQPASPDAVFEDLPPHAVVRFWAFQSMAVNPATHALDWTALDRVVQAAEADDVKLAMVLSDQAGTCDDDHWHDAAWYRGGFRRVYDDGARHADVVSYATWVHTIVPRYAHSTAIAYWEAVNEPQVSSCPAGASPVLCVDHAVCQPDAAATLRSFFDVIGREIHRMDRWHPVASGTIGDDQCGTGAGIGRSDRDWLTVARSPGLDVLTVHDYATGKPLLQDDRAAVAARDVGKPVIYEEVGLPAGVGTRTCDRTRVVRALSSGWRSASPSVASATSSSISAPPTGRTSGWVRDLRIGTSSRVRSMTFSSVTVRCRSSTGGVRRGRSRRASTGRTSHR